MPSPPQIDIDALLKPIPGPNPAGKSVPFPVREKLDLMRKEVLPEHFAKDDPLRPSEAIRADWETIQKVCIETLTTTSKDLLLAARLLEALVKSRSAAGLRDGVTLLRRLVEECWDRILPAIEDDDVEVRAAAFNWLDDPDRGARFPNTVRSLTLLVDGEKKIDWQTWRQAQSGKAPELAAEFEKAVVAAPRAVCKLNVEDLDAAWGEFQKLSAILGEKMGDAAPGLIAFREALEQTRVLAAQILERKGPDPDAAVAAAVEEPVAAPDEAAGTSANVADPAAPRAPATRAQVYQQIAAAANLLRQLEPHSPIPYLLQYAVELGALPFPDLMKVLVRNPEVLDSMNRVLGIKDPSKTE